MTPIVVVGYNRANSLNRLLNSLNDANYDRDDVPLIISIDKGDNADVLQVAQDFIWMHGNKEIRYQKENLKLRNHILKCGDISLEYGSVIILEDDLYVSTEFYRYSVSALDFIKNDHRIGGISLYNHLYNVNVFEPFYAFPDGYDNWYFQFASSWGEAWTKDQWISFKKWYEENKDKDISGNDIPTTVTNWSQSSWLKYFIKYLVVSNKYFLYPRESLTTNFSDAGTHAAYDGTNYQVPLQAGKKLYHFAELDESKAVYDSFYENIRLSQALKIEGDVVIDLYGSKPVFDYRYILTSKVLDYEICDSFARSMKPIDANVFYKVLGKDLFLYDSSQIKKNSNKYNRVKALEYRIRMFSRKTYVDLLLKFFQDTRIYLSKRILRKH